MSHGTVNANDAAGIEERPTGSVNELLRASVGEENHMNRPPISDPVKRTVRQRCAFGCVICGLPLYHYDHIFGYSEDRGHVAEEITLLCARHHDEKTRRLLPLEKVEDANARPHNLRAGVSSAQELHYSGDSCSVKLGDSFFAADLAESRAFAALIIDDLALIGFRLIDNHLLLNLGLMDDRGNYLLVVDRNEVVVIASQWDITFVGKQLTIRQAPRELLVEIAFDTPNAVAVNRGRFLHNGAEVLVFPDRVVAGGFSIQQLGTHASLVNVGIAIGGSAGSRPISGGIWIEDVPRHLPEDSERDAWLSDAFPS